MTQRPLSALVAALLISAVSGCATDIGFLDERITNVEIQSAYSRNGAAAMAAAGAPVEIRGAPPGGADAETTVAGLRLPGGLPQGPLRAVAPGEAATGQRFLIIFGLRNPPNPLSACRDTPDGRPSPTLSAFIAYCIGSRTASSALLTHAMALNPGDEAFAVAFQRALTAILPRRNPMMERDNCSRLRCR